MSGTSLDGVDLALCHFTSAHTFIIEKAITAKYPAALEKKLKNCMRLSAEKLTELDRQLGIYFGKISKTFLEKNKLKADYISSHGHTVFHQPEKKYTLQIGNGAAIAAVAGIPVINDFRSADVALGGQGAPLVPIGDELWFGNYGACINLGGIANLSLKKNNVRIAYDITICNMALNELAQKLGKPFDKNGAWARKGKLNEPLLKKLNALEYFKQRAPKSLGKEWYEKKFRPLLKGNANDLLRTVTEHVAWQLHTATKTTTGKLLLTGGGSHNQFLIERLKHFSSLEIIVPNTTLVDFKEAAIFALLGYLRVHETHNVLASVTGARHDHCAGNLHLA